MPSTIFTSAYRKMRTTRPSHKQCDRQQKRSVNEGESTPARNALRATRTLAVYLGAFIQELTLLANGIGAGVVFLGEFKQVQKQVACFHQNHQRNAQRTGETVLVGVRGREDV